MSVDPLDLSASDPLQAGGDAPNDASIADPLNLVHHTEDQSVPKTQSGGQAGSKTVDPLEERDPLDDSFVAAAAALPPPPPPPPTAPPAAKAPAAPPVKAPAALQPAKAAAPPMPKKAQVQGRLSGSCIHCGVAMGNFLGTLTDDGPLHNECIPAYRRLHVERCAHCDCPLRETRVIVTGKKVHPQCVANFKSGLAFVPPSKRGVLKKFSVGRSFFSGKNWKERFFVLSKESGLAYYESSTDYSAGKKPCGAVPLDPTSTRLVTKPNRLVHKEALNPSTELVLVFKEKGQELKLLVSCLNWTEHEEWCRALEFYIKIVDDAKDVDDR